MPITSTKRSYHFLILPLPPNILTPCYHSAMFFPGLDRDSFSFLYTQFPSILHLQPHEASWGKGLSMATSRGDYGELPHTESVDLSIPVPGDNVREGLYERTHIEMATLQVYYSVNLSLAGNFLHVKFCTPSDSKHVHKYFCLTFCRPTLQRKPCFYAKKVLFIMLIL